jgi:hypothetical protein
VSEKKLKVIKAVLNVDYEPEHESDGSQHGGTHHRPVSETFDEVRVVREQRGCPIHPPVH